MLGAFSRLLLMYPCMYMQNCHKELSADPLKVGFIVCQPATTLARRATFVNRQLCKAMIIVTCLEIVCGYINEIMVIPARPYITMGKHLVRN